MFNIINILLETVILLLSVINCGVCVCVCAGVCEKVCNKLHSTGAWLLSLLIAKYFLGRLNVRAIEI